MQYGVGKKQDFAEAARMGDHALYNNNQTKLMAKNLSEPRIYIAL